jgi:signal transduction histidine kinase
LQLAFLPLLVPLVNRWQFFLASLLGIACLGLTVAVIFSARTNQKIQADLQAQQIEINKGTQSQQIGTNLLRDIAVVAGKNDKLKELLARNGFSLTATQTASPVPSTP